MRAMVGKEIASVSIDGAARLVGRAMFGDDWVGAITTRERWLIERYVEGRRGPSPSSTSWMMGGRRWAEYPSDPALVVETERARDRDDWQNDQWEQALDWLEDNGFDTTADSVDQGELEGAIAKAFPQSAKPANKVGRPPAVDWDLVKEEAIRLMDYHGEFGPDSPEWNAQARLEEAIETFCDSKFKERPAKSTIQRRIKPWLAEWRKTKT
jgi:hypothetical protein